MENRIRIIDSHVHLDMIEQYNPGRIQWLKQNSCAVVSWSYFSKINFVSELESSLKIKASLLKTHFTEGLSCRYLAGVHPRCIPPSLKPEQIEHLLKPYLEDDPLCIGIGEIGLETNDAQQTEVFIAQLELGRSMRSKGAVIGIHTPKLNKPEMTATTMNILKQFQDMKDRIVIDHCAIETIGWVLDENFWAGVTLSPDKTSWTELKQIVAENVERIERIMCNTDSGGRFFEDLVRYRDAVDLPEKVPERLFYSNAAQFFKLDQMREAQI